MADKPINLNKARKARAKASKRRAADQNAVSFGRTRAEKDAAKRARDDQIARLDAHKRDP